jgi:hypothetical protein
MQLSYKVGVFVDAELMANFIRYGPLANPLLTNALQS